MYKFSKISISKIFAIVGIILVIIALVLYFFRSAPKKNYDDQLLYRLISSLKDRWELGDIEGKFYSKEFFCDKLLFNGKNIDSEFLKCNPHYLECFLQKKAANAASIIDQKSGIELKFLKKNERFIKITKSNSVILNASVRELGLNNIRIKLENTCKEVILPQRLYSAGIAEEQKYIWDNFNQNIYLDKFYVTNFDIYLWAKTFKINDPLVISDPSKWHLPSTNLPIKKRYEYCHSLGKNLMASHVLDAASFIPADYEEARPDFVYKYPYPWTKNSRGVWLHESKNDNSYDLNESDCSLAYVEECLDRVDYKYFSTESVSWMGIYNVLGHYPELIDNKFELNKNLKASSFYFKSFSSWHEIGKRAYWDGLGDQNSNFDFGIEQPEDVSKIEVAFRCMRYGLD